MNPMVAGANPLMALIAQATGGAQPQAPEQVADPLTRALEYAAQQRAQLGEAPQMDPSAMTDQAAAKRQQELAAALSQSGYIPNSGAMGAFAQIFSAIQGGKLEKKAGETMADAIARQMKQQQEAEQYAERRKAFDEGPGKVEELARRSQALGVELTPEELFAGKKADPRQPRGFQMSAGLVLNKDTGEVEQVEGYEAMRSRIAAAGRAPGGGEAKPPKPPSGYRYTADGSGLEAIPGGPADKPKGQGVGGKPLPAEARMKLGMLRAAREALNKYEAEVLPEGGGFNESRLFVGPGGGYMDEAVNNVLRVESGAAVPEEETKRGVARYGASVLNQESTARANAQQLRDKIDILERELTGVDPGAPAQPAAGGIRILRVRPAGE